ncbi:MAG: type II toxin-antitoxin system HicA family toxin [Dehalococcoidia bacterium]|jgi:hypothetical protein|nr:type II toxin-antitoxin system HicA family toxin [Dehalococcoidia bacterium]
MRDSELDQMRRNPGSVKRRQLVAALRARGWVVVREGKHEIWANGGTEVQLPHTLKGTGTIRSIVKRVIEQGEGNGD